MEGPQFQPSAPCASCSESACPLNEGTCPTPNEDNRKLKGWVFSGACLLVFITPILLAILGSLIFRQNPTYGLLAGIVGFALGTGVSSSIARIAKLEESRSSSETTPIA